jgi:hypothetical protein
MMTALPTGQPGNWDTIPGRVEIFVISVSRPALGLIQTAAQWVLVALSPAVKQQVLEADHSPLSSVEVVNVWSFTSTPAFVFMSSWLSAYFSLGTAVFYTVM